MASSLLSSEGVAEGQRVWIKNKSSDPREPPFLAGTVVEADGTTAKIALDNWGSGETVAVSESELDVANAATREYAEKLDAANAATRKEAAFRITCSKVSGGPA